MEILDTQLKSRYERYALLSEGSDSVSVSYLASATCLSESIVLSDLQRLLNMGVFGNSAYINYATRMLVLRQPNAPYTQSASSGGVRAGAKREPPTSGTYVQAAVLPEIKEKNGALLVILLVGGILFLITGVSQLGDALNGLAAASSMSFGTWAGIIVPLIYCGVGGGALAVRSSMRKRTGRFKKYRALAEGQDPLSLQQLAGSAGVSVQTATNDIRYMISRGYWGPKAYIDAEEKTLRLKPERKNTDESVKRPEAQGAAKPKSDNQYYAIICEIRELNDSIADEAVSDRISQIEEITGKIFRTVEEKPEKLPQIRSFMSYYLPTTLKLLHSYSTFEKQGVTGDNIESSKKNIERILDTLVKGFTQQLDQLYKDDALDISTDIEVLESMLKRDGLDKNGSPGASAGK